MEIRAVDEGAGHREAGYVIEMLGEVDYRALRHEACERALAILEREVDELRRLVGVLTGNLNVPPPQTEPVGGPGDGLPAPAGGRERDTTVNATARAGSGGRSHSGPVRCPPVP